MKKFYLIAFFAVCVVIFQSNTKFSSQPPTGYTGASGSFCSDCHSTFSLNSGGGSVTASGLPVGSYNAGQVYNFTLTINHGAVDRRRWGFSVSSLNGSNSPVGTFSTTNANAANNTDELSHNTAVSTGNSNSYTYTNLTWTAPANPSVADRNVSFYFVGVAGNGANGSGSDYVYSGSSAIVLPISLKQFTAAIGNNKRATLNWVTTQEVNSKLFEIEKSDDNQIFYKVGTVAAAGNSNAEIKYSYTDITASYFNKPVFYRLKQIDKDGTFKYSAVVQVTSKANETFVNNVYPTLVKSNSIVTIEVVSNTNQVAQVQTIGIDGRSVKNYTYQLQQGVNMIRMNVGNNLQNGVNFLKVVTAKERQNIPIIVFNK